MFEEKENYKYFRIMERSVRQWSGRPGFIHRSIQKMILDAALFNTLHYKEKWSMPGKGVEPFPTVRFSSDWRGNIQVTLDCIRQLYLPFFRIIEASTIKQAEMKEKYQKRTSENWKKVLL